MARQIDEARVQRSWHDRGFGFRESVCAAGDVWTDEGHSVREIVMVASGRVAIQIDSETIRPAPGEECIIPAGRGHEIRNVGEEPARIFFGYEREA
jgi:mannose-6-phosphate isomerase-like protein (cupin superfamily)